MKKRPTQADVARKANVSQALVSYVLNNNLTISVPAETRQRILEAIDELGYEPDRLARSLRTRKTNTIACVIPDITNPFHPAFAQGLQHVADRHGYDVILYNTERDADREHKALRSLRQGRVDGVVITPLHLGPDELLTLLDIQIPVVVQGTGVMPLQVGGLPLDSLHVNNVAAACTAVSFLIGRGHARIAFIAGQKDTPPQQDRELGYRRALEEHGIPFDHRLVQDGDFKEAGGHQAMRALLVLSPQPTAVFAASDLMAIDALIAIKEAGLKVPPTSPWWALTISRSPSWSARLSLRSHSFKPYLASVLPKCSSIG
jgi:LacI family transcriptional regulator